MRTAFVFSLGLILLTAAASNARAQTLAILCHGAQRPGQIAELLFGRDIGNRVGVSEVAWRRFVAREITPRFPDGLTVSNATGQWRDPANGKMVREPSKRVEIVLPGRADDEMRLDAIAGAYKRRFHSTRCASLCSQPAFHSSGRALRGLAACTRPS